MSSIANALRSHKVDLVFHEPLSNSLELYLGLRESPGTVRQLIDEVNTDLNSYYEALLPKEETYVDPDPFIDDNEEDAWWNNFYSRLR